MDKTDLEDVDVPHDSPAVNGYTVDRGSHGYRVMRYPQSGKYESWYFSAFSEIVDFLERTWGEKAGARRG